MPVLPAYRNQSIDLHSKYNIILHNLEDKGVFFPSIKRNPSSFIKRTPDSVISWMKNLRAAGKTTLLVTDSYGDFSGHLMHYAVG